MYSMRVIYKPKGKAREYSPLALNLYNGCSNGCKYCYVPNYCRKNREEFKNNTVVRKDVLKKLERDCQELEGGSQQILMCFTSDPYQKAEETNKITRQAIKILNRYGLNFQILTKSGSRAEKDFGLYKKGDTYAVTLTFDSEIDSRKYEPEADIPEQRIKSLNEAKKRGITTWVSLEPVISPDQSLNLIDMTCRFVDLFKVGKLNGYPEMERKINWRQFGLDAIEKLEKYKKNYYIKKDLEKYLN
ncbi:hypothetical protein ES705_05504 [subsurface metagenome]